MAVIPRLKLETLKAICDVIAHTTEGMSNSEIDGALRATSIPIPSNVPNPNKRGYLLNVLNAKQTADRCSNNVLAFLKYVMSPPLYINKQELFESRRVQVNQVLIFEGLEINQAGEIKFIQKATTINEAKRRTSQLIQKLNGQAIHYDVLKYCKEELLQENYFHAILEATKSLADKIREKAGLNLDGAPLVDTAFGLSNGIPILAMNELSDENQRNQQKGLMSMIKGAFSMYRNPHAHAPKIKWALNESDAVDAMIFISLLHKFVDECVPTRVSNS